MLIVCALCVLMLKDDEHLLIPITQFLFHLGFMPPDPWVFSPGISVVKDCPLASGDSELLMEKI